MKTIVVALGGNALQNKGDDSAAAQQRVARATAKQLAALVAAGNHVVIVHGNGPQVGAIVLQQTAGDSPGMPLDTCVAMSQGQIGYWLQSAMTEALATRGIDAGVATVVTRMLVDSGDESFATPTKPIGQFYDTEQAAREAHGADAVVVEDAGRGWRKVVASPKPMAVLELDAIKALVSAGQVVVAAGGGGVPVVQQPDGTLAGVEAVIDKDFSAALLAAEIGADELLILTAVDGAMIHFGTPEQTLLGQVSVDEMEQYIQQGHFASGSMLPKTQAAAWFVRETGGHARITSIALADGDGGTTIV